ncbi:glycerophosphocholine phosphodiesterase GPCPD1-like isoform X2 [Trichoplusia ni]|nr:glycerophosphocholine phosphodiesterase GPCPD1-like isoform X2 [Trichoplusia ni]XP_026737759.1 glycerophosphocholine phosphodiesterase GPCPD1-like isoform X2 [Trichoplusia ni]XP_026737760.1 glycerophosphocholine phosphodiesterase GPCPD1-like isoform X2 [Trichoplusia ni]
MSGNQLESGAQVASQQWLFTVAVPTIEPKEKVFITGSIPELGEWDPSKIVILDHKENTDLWSKTVTIPNTCDVLYRYGKCIVGNDADANSVIIRQWEIHIQPRVIKETVLHPFVDTYGESEGKQNVSAGWLTTQTLLQFKFMNNPLKLKGRLAEKILNIKVTPVKLSFETTVLEETSLSTDGTDLDLPTGVLVDVSTLDNDPSVCVLKTQEQFGRQFKPSDVLIINITAPDVKALAYLVDFYAYSSRAGSEDPPCHVGYTYILPNMFKPSEGSLQLPVTCNVKHRPLGVAYIDYLIVKPMPQPLCNLQVTHAKYWNPSWTGLEVGHRGLGASFKTKEGNPIRENTIASLKKAAASGADLLEFDVQLSKDMIPVIYHDYYVCISMKRKREVEFTEMLELPVKDLTLEHLQKLKVYHLIEGRNQEMLFNDEELEEHQPFPTLENALGTIDGHVGFNVELKWTMEMQDGTFELNHPFDMNTYVDKVLEVILQHAGDRRIVFSCFNPDICTMLRYKQNRYPVMFLTVGITKKYEPYRDSRCSSIPAAVKNAISTDILGIVVHTEDLLRDPSQVKMAKDAGLVIFCWGDDNNDKNTIKMLKDMGLHAVIYDKLDQYITKEVKESIFLMEARESQHDIMDRAAREESTSHVSDTQEPVAVESGSRPFLDLSRRKTIQDISTVTSLESLASSIDLRDEPLEKDDKKLKRNLDKDAQKEANLFNIYCPNYSSSKNKKRNRQN